MNIAAIDLNLLLVVEAVLRTRSATRAGIELFVTQSAVSNAMKRAREVFGDPLVRRRPHGFELTARGAALEPELSRWLESTRRIIAPAPAFVPFATTRTFSIACADSIAVSLLGPMLRILRRRAPGAKLRLLTLDRLIQSDALARNEIDLLIGIPPVVPPNHREELVYTDPMECIVRRDHERVKRRLSLPAYAALPHVELALFGTVDDTVDRALARHGRARTVQVAVPHFSSIPLAVLESDCVATVSRRLARAFCQRMPLRSLRPPVELAPLEIRQVWLATNDDDPAVTFLRGVVREASGSKVSAPIRRAGARSSST